MSRLVALLLLTAGKIMPRARADWLAAMRAEISYLPPRAALSWALGCVFAAVKQRFFPMQTGTLRIPRWVMFVEAIGCFGPLTFGWYAIAFGQPGVLLRSWDVIDNTYAMFPGGPYILVMLISGLVVGLLGPIGLFYGLRYVVTGRGIGNRTLGYSLVVVPPLYAVLGTIAGYLVGPPDFSPIWSHTIVLTVLPIACVAHLMFLARREVEPAMLSAA